MEGGILFVADLKLFDKGPGVWEDGGQGNWLSKTHNGCKCFFIFFLPLFSTDYFEILLLDLEKMFDLKQGVPYLAEKVEALESHRDREDGPALLGPYLGRVMGAYNKTRARRTK